MRQILCKSNGQIFEFEYFSASERQLSQYPTLAKNKKRLSQNKQKGQAGPECQ